MANEINNTGQPKKNNKKKWLLILGLGLLTAGASIFGYRYYKKNKQTIKNDSSAPDFKAEKPKGIIKSKTPPKAGSKSSPTLPPKPSSKQGNGTPNFTTAPKQEQQSGTKIKQILASTIDGRQIALNIHAAALRKDFTKVYEQLGKIKTTKDYSSVNKVFSSLFLNGVRQTLVTGLSNTFKDQKQKDTLRKSFFAMGLKYDGRKWSLSGIEPSAIITTSPTKVWKDPQTAVPVPVNMVLGQQVCQRGNFTLFENDKQYFLVETKHIKPYNS